MTISHLLWGLFAVAAIGAARLTARAMFGRRQGETLWSTPDKGDTK